MFGMNFTGQKNHGLELEPLDQIEVDKTHSNQQHANEY